MNKETAIEIASKYANDIWLFGGVDKECVSKVCKTLLNELDTANKKLDKIKDYLSNYKEPLYIPDDLLKFLEKIIGW